MYYNCVPLWSKKGKEIKDRLIKSTKKYRSYLPTNSWPFFKRGCYNRYNSQFKMAVLYRSVFNKKLIRKYAYFVSFHWREISKVMVDWLKAKKETGVFELFDFCRFFQF
jgi:hypothetical protein